MRSILLNYAEPMKGSSAHSYYYDPNYKLNVIKNEEGMVLPFIDSSLNELCISTKTEALREADDAFNDILLISTKTFSEEEADDQGATFYE